MECKCKHPSGPGPPLCVGRVGGWQKWRTTWKVSRTHPGPIQGAAERQREVVAEKSWTKPCKKSGTKPTPQRLRIKPLGIELPKRIRFRGSPRDWSLPTEKHKHAFHPTISSTRSTVCWINLVKWNVEQPGQNNKIDFSFCSTTTYPWDSSFAFSLNPTLQF